MVDGVKIGESVSSVPRGEMGGVPDGSFLDSQDFGDADMVVIQKRPVTVKGEKIPNCYPETIAKETNYICYGIYGNVLVESSIEEDNITQIKKYVWAYRKPYILNGVWNERK